MSDSNRPDAPAADVAASAAARSAERDIVCPTCGQPCKFGPSNPSRPFCSPRCRNADFGAWATEAYRIAKAPGQPEDEDEGA
jgi:endogenous inhibitor of DNA gyrase (YacG/DUF329 family)